MTARQKQDQERSPSDDTTVEGRKLRADALAEAHERVSGAFGDEPDPAREVQHVEKLLERAKTRGPDLSPEG